MKGLKPAAIIIVALALCGAATVEESSAVTITSPTEGSKVGLTGIKLVYEVAPGPKHDHVHIYVDGDPVGPERPLKGTYTVDKLIAGTHTFCVRVVDKGHTPVGQEKCVRAQAGNVPPMGY
jgi:hypothetical protein